MLIVVLHLTNLFGHVGITDDSKLKSTKVGVVCNIMMCISHLIKIWQLVETLLVSTDTWT